MLCRAALSLLLLSFSLAERRVAITIDDLPVAQSGRNACEFSRLQDLSKRLLKPFRAGRVPLTGFVVAGNCAALSTEQKRGVLRLWTGAGAELGNHTYSHPGLNATPIEEYEREILRADTLLKQLLETDRIRYFRSPMLHTGADRATKERLERFLAENGYQQAPVTFDNSDWMFALSTRTPWPQDANWPGACAMPMSRTWSPSSSFSRSVPSKSWAGTSPKSC
jgi:peptidoglycan/xylan/chitin deacetylase (PgdA/CDA1 family)